MTVRTMAHDDETLLASLASGSHAAFAALVARHSGRFFSVAFRIVAHKEDAEDVVQEAFMALWRYPKSWDEARQTKFTTWFYRIVVNKALDLKRKGQTIGQDIDVEDAAGRLICETDLEADLALKQQRAKVASALRTLPDRQHAAIVLCFYENIPQSEAADILGVSLKALESLLIRAKGQLRKDLMLGNTCENV